MPFAFDNDIFISYAHIDNIPLTEDQEGWISTFHSALEKRLAQLMGEKPAIWRDPKLQGNDLFADEIVEQLPKVALLISVVSPRYIESEWCIREYKAFLDAAEQSGGAAIGNKSRLFKVVKTFVPYDEHPDEMQPLLGYEFYELDAKGRPREFNEVFGPEAVRQFWAKLEDLAYDIHQLLERIKEDEAALPPLPEDADVIYLAPTTSDLVCERDMIKRELQRRGVRVLPDRPLPVVGPELEEAVKGYLEEADLAVHMIGGNYGVVPESATLSVTELQLSASTHWSKERPLPRIIWMPPQLKPADERQRNFVEAIQTDSDAMRGADLLQTTIEDLKGFIDDRLDALANGAAEPTISQEGAASIYIICEQEDLDDVGALAEQLFEQGFEVFQSTFDADQATNREAHQGYLQICDAALIYYGHAKEPWVRMKLMDLRKAAGYGRDRPLLAKGVYVAPPESPQKGRFRTHEAPVLQSDSEANALDALKPFLDALRKNRAD